MYLHVHVHVHALRPEFRARSDPNPNPADTTSLSLALAKEAHLDNLQDFKDTTALTEIASSWISPNTVHICIVVALRK
jgi:hypothetical protein